LPKFHKLLFLLIKWILKNKIIIQPINAKPDRRGTSVFGP
jgi:hypothetical protein